MKAGFLRFTITFSLLLMGQSSTDLTRPKRIIGGGDIFKTDDRAYNTFRAMYYYVWYGYTFLCYQQLRFWQLWSYFKTFVFGLGCGENPQNLICHGTLITPKIVQTACHCLIHQVQIPTGHWSKTIKMVEFENKFTAYMGEVDVRYFNWGVKTENFVLHQRCGQLQQRPRSWRYDLAWITLEKEIHDTPGLLNSDWGRIEIAGPYKSEEIQATHMRAIQERHVCLILGFGQYNQSTVKMSKNLRYAWIQLLDDEHCKDASWSSWELNLIIDYAEVRTWACAVPVQDRPRLLGGYQLGGKHGGGDSGGPVSCDNNYFAVLSAEIFQKKQVRAGFDYMMFEVPIRYAMEANSVQYRRSFEKDIIQYSRFVLRADVNEGRKLSIEYKRLPTSGYTNETLTVGHTNETFNKFRKASTTQNTGHLIVLVLCSYVSIIM